MATHSSVLVWRIPGSAEPGGLLSMGSHRVRHDWSNLATAAAAAAAAAWGFQGGTSGKEPACQYRRHKRPGFDPWVGKIPWSRKRKPTPVFLPGKFHGQMSQRATVYGVIKSRTLLNVRARAHTHTHTHTHNRIILVILYTVHIIYHWC